MEPAVLSGSETTRGSLPAGGPGDERDRVLVKLDELRSLTAGLLADTPRRHLDAARTRLTEDRFNLVVLGEFKRGKSTLVNALLGRDLLPTGVLPLTSVVTTIGAGERDLLLISFQNGRQEERPLSELADYVTEERNPGNRLGVESARVELDHDLLRGGLELVDTPGIGSIHSHNTEVAHGFLPRVDAALCVLDAGQPLSEAERELLRKVAERVPHLLVVLNKIDHLDAADGRVTLEFVRSALRDVLGNADAELFPVSARRGRGLSPLLARVRRLGADERRVLLLRSVAQLGRSTAGETAQAARFEQRAIELPLDQLGARVEMFERRISELTAASAEAGDLLDRGVERALDEVVNEPLQRHARDQEAHLRERLHSHLDHVGSSSPRELSLELQAWIDTTIRDEFERLAPRLEASIAMRLTELEQRFAQRIEQILGEIQQVAEDVFGARAADVLPATGLRASSRFSFKLTDVEHALDIIVGFSRTITPGRLGRRLVIRDAEQRLLDMTDRHAGRLRSELARRVTDSVREYRRELTAGVEEAIEAIRAAIGRATADRRRGEDHARTRLDELVSIERRCLQLATEFEQWSGGPPARGGGE